MSRIAKAPVDLPKGVTVTIAPESVSIKGAKGTLSIPLVRGVTVVQADQHLQVQYTDQGIDLTLGFSHPVSFPIPEGISIETPTVTEIVIKGIDRQKVGQVAAEIRDIRPPEPYKGKGVRYAGEKIALKEGKKK
jgi:large subunit ribosomal protein L6